MVIFDSLNPYDSIEFLVGDSPEELVRAIRGTVTPIKIVAIVPYGTRHVAYVMGDVRKSQPTKPKKQPNLKGK